MTLALAAPALGAPIVFAPAPTSPETVADEPYGLASADFNGDGNVDLASSHFLVGSVSVLLGDGTGNFQQPATSPEPTSNFLLELKSADFNSDGNPDLVGLGGGSSSVVILIGDGSGNFTEPPTSPEVASSAPLTAVVTGVAPGEFTGDNNQDLAVVSAFADEVTILEGSGDGNFTIDQSFGVVADPSDVLAADIAGSAALDLVVPSLNALTTTVLIGDGSGGFTEPATSPEATGQGDSKLAAGDLDEDGDDDIVVANLNAASDVLLNQGSGNFTAGTTVPGSASSADLADFDDDGHLDLARGNFTTGGANVSVGDGHGAFAAPVATAVVTTPIFVQDVNVNDFDNDGSPDLAIPASSVDQVHVFLNGTPFRRTVSVTSAGNGSGRVTSAPVGIDCPGDCSERYAEGTQVTLTAAPNAGSEFSGFSGGGCSGSATTCQITLANKPAKVQATFTVRPAPLDPPAAAPPETTITREPRNPRPKRTRLFFESEAGATFTCSVDNGTPEPCTSPVTYRGLKRGRHTFAVAASLAGKTDPSPAVAEFKVKRKRR